MTALEGVTPFPPEFAERYQAAGYWEDKSLRQFFTEICSRFASRVALVANGEQITYAQLEVRAELLARHLYQLGLRPRDRFVMQLPNVPEFAYLYLALQKVGVMPVMALATHRYTEISHFVKLSQAVGYAVPERQGDFSFGELAGQLQEENPCLRLIFSSGDTSFPGAISIKHLLETESETSAKALAAINIEPTDPALFLLSGGTTGVPKLIPRTHNDYIYNSRASAAVNDIHPEDALLVVLPLAHNFPLASPGMQGFLLSGARVVLSTSTSPADIFRLIEQEQVTHLELVPALIIRLVNDPSLKDYDLSSIRIVNSGGQKLQSEVKRQTEKLIPGCQVQEVFGMAEGLLCMGRLDDSEEVRYATAGRPVSPGDELRLMDEEGNEVVEGEIGELFVRGPYTLRGYYLTPEYNERTFTTDGFYRSGDLMRRHPSGNYVVEGRKKDLINRGGEKISAEEIENLILSHPAVLNVACVHMPDPVLGERMCAYVIPKTGESLTLTDITGYLTEKGIAKFKLPERLELVEEFPLSKVGKVAKNVLAQRIADLIRQG